MVDQILFVKEESWHNKELLIVKSQSIITQSCEEDYKENAKKWITFAQTKIL